MDKYICSCCNGEKEIIIETKSSSPEDIVRLEYFYKCTMCNGTGTVDWITNILKNKGQVLIERRQVRNNYVYDEM